MGESTNNLAIEPTTTEEVLHDIHLPAFSNYKDAAKIAGKLHGRVISRGTKIQRSIYNYINKSNKHLDVYHEYNIKLPKGGQKKIHKIDIIIIDENNVRAFDSKGRSFNSTYDGQKILEEYLGYINILKEKFPNKEVEYSFLKQGWNAPKGKSPTYEYIEPRGMKVFDTYEFMLNNYGVSESELVDKVEIKLMEELREMFPNNIQNSAMNETIAAHEREIIVLKQQITVMNDTMTSQQEEIDSLKQTDISINTIVQEDKLVNQHQDTDK